jgi:hypothetical protein
MSSLVLAAALFGYYKSFFFVFCNVQMYSILLLLLISRTRYLKRVEREGNVARCIRQGD